MPKGFDCATKLNSTSAKALKAAGFDYVGRYLGNSWKSFDKNEAKAIKDTGLLLISIFEKNSTKVSYFSKAQGIADAREAESLAKSLGQPKGTAIYFTVDYDAQPSHMDEIKEYVDGLNRTLVDYEVGLYGSYSVMMAVKGLVKYYWQTYAWSKGKVADFIHMHQFENDIHVAGIGIDRNDIKKSNVGAWGQTVVQAASIKESISKKEESKLAGENLYQPSNQSIKDSTRRVLTRLSEKDNGIDKLWIKKLDDGTATQSDMLGLIYVALDRELIQGSNK